VPSDGLLTFCRLQGGGLLRGRSVSPTLLGDLSGGVGAGGDLSPGVASLAQPGHVVRGGVELGRQGEKVGKCFDIGGGCDPAAVGADGAVPVPLLLGGWLSRL